ncbi:MAG: oligosaccharide flippase family protein [Thermoprotei archaeon]
MASQKLGSSETQRLQGGVSYIAAMQVFDLTVNLIFFAAIGRTLTARGTGEVAMAFLVMSAFSTITVFALNTSSTRFIAMALGKRDSEEISAVYRSALKATILSSTLAAAVSLLLIGWLRVATGLTSVEFLLVIVAALTMDFTSVLGGVMYGLSMYREVAIQNMMYYALSRLPAVILARYMGALGVIISLAVGDVPVLVYTIYVLRGKTLGAKAASKLRDLMKYGWPLYALSLLGFAQGWLATASLYAVSGLAAMGTYYLVSSLIPFFSIVYTSITTVLFPALSYRLGEGGIDAVRDLLGTMEKVMLFLVVPVSLATAVASPTILRLVYGTKYISQWPVLSLLLLSMIPASESALYSIAIQSIGKTSKQLLVGVIGLMINVASLTVLVPALSSLGAAVATLVTSTSGALLYYFYVKRIVAYRFSFPKKHMYVGVASALSVLAVQTSLGFCYPFNVPLDVIAFALSVYLISRKLKPLTKDEWDWIVYAYRLKRLTKVLRASASLRDTEIYFSGKK